VPDENTPIKELLAIAAVRRLLLELGYVPQPEEPSGLVGPITLWVAQPRADLDGLSPAQALDLPDGAERVRQCLAKMLSAEPAMTGASSRPNPSSPPG
jgi:hypothetical protein